MVTNYIGADVDCRMTELAVERGGKIVCRDRAPTDIASLREFLDSVSGRKVVVIEEGRSDVGLAVPNPEGFRGVVLKCFTQSGTKAVLN